METGLHAMRLAGVSYFIPLFFVYNPALVLQAPWTESLKVFVFALVGICFIAAGMQNYLWRYGTLRAWARPLLVIGGLLLVHPETYTDVIGAALLLFTIILPKIRKGQGIPRQGSQ